MSVSFSWAQTYTNEATSTQDRQLLSQSQQQNISGSVTAQTSSAVFIDQIGENNNIRLNDSSLQSNFAISQIGENNIINLQLRADVINQSVVQRGTNHLINATNNPIVVADCGS